MKDTHKLDVIIIGGSYAGLSAAMALGRSLRHVLIIDSGKPCNQQTPHSHNFLTQDGSAPREIAQLAQKQVLAYPSVRFLDGKATIGTKSGEHYHIELDNGSQYKAPKILFATGVKDLLPPIPGLSECWGISALHCPYCHGFEYTNAKTGILNNGDMGYEFSKLISNWTQDLTLFTQGEPTLNPEQLQKLQEHRIDLQPEKISHLSHEKGYLKSVHLENGHSLAIEALYLRAEFQQHCDIPKQLGCTFNEHGYIDVDEFQRTSLSGVYAAGDNTNMFRSVSAAVAAGNIAGAIINKELISESF